MKIVNGHSYSLEPLPDYKLRLRAEIDVGKDHPARGDYYTTQPDVDIATQDLISLATKQGKKLVVVDTATKEQDDASADMIDEMFLEGAE